MCTLAAYRDVSPDFPLVVVANRDEFLGRPSESPHPWSNDDGIRLEVVAGRDLQAGGTWLGCRTDGSGRIVGLLNRRPAVDRAASGPGERSRGLLCLEALQAPSIAAALGDLDAPSAARYGGFNLFLADLEHGLVVDNGDGVRRVDLEPGLSVLTNLDVNDPRCPRLAGASRRFGLLTALLAAGATPEEAVPKLAAVLASHDEDDAATVRFDGSTPAAALPFSKICVHVGEYGTTSSSMIFVDRRGGVRYFHADGPPCAAPFSEVALPA